MTRRASLAVAVLASLVFLSPARTDEAPGKEIKLFNGKNLEGWKTFLKPGSTEKPEDVWSIQDGVIICKGKPNGYLLTEKDYGNYVLKLKWRWPAGSKGGNSGVFVHVSGEDKIWPKGVEAQLFANNAGDFWLVGDYKLEVDPTRKKGTRQFVRLKTDKPVEKEVGEWNEYTITCKGDTIKLEINGQVVNEGKKAESTMGKILLQSEGAEIHFKDITLTPIK